MEIWRDIEGYEGLYQISNEGRVKRLESKNCRYERILKPSKYGTGYLRIELCENGEKNPCPIHQLVAKTFIPNPQNLTEIDHINGDKTDNRLCNLRWCTHPQNMSNPITRNKIAESISKKVYQYTLNGKLVKIWNSATECDRNGFKRQKISLCCLGKRKKHKGYIWSFNPM